MNGEAPDHVVNFGGSLDAWVYLTDCTSDLD